MHCESVSVPRKVTCLSDCQVCAMKISVVVYASMCRYVLVICVSALCAVCFMVCSIL